MCQVSENFKTVNARVLNFQDNTGNSYLHRVLVKVLQGLEYSSSSKYARALNMAKF